MICSKANHRPLSGRHRIKLSQHIRESIRPQGEVVPSFFPSSKPSFPLLRLFQSLRGPIRHLSPLFWVPSQQAPQPQPLALQGCKCWSFATNALWVPNRLGGGAGVGIAECWGFRFRLAQSHSSPAHEPELSDLGSLFSKMKLMLSRLPGHCEHYLKERMDTVQTLYTRQL